MRSKDALIMFQGKKIRRIKHKGEWHFSVVDIVAALTGSPTPRQYWGKVKDREFVQLQSSPIWVRLKLSADDGKLRFTDCVKTEDAFRIIQSIPSRSAEPFKRWLAKVGHERVKEIQEPESAQRRMIELYRSKGYSDTWIEKRVRAIMIREELTDEWRNRDVKEGKEFSILTAEMSKAAFGLTPSEHKKLKSLKSQSLRDHMTGLELVFSMLSEKVTTEITRAKDAQGFDRNLETAKKGGAIAGDARQNLEFETGDKVVSDANYLEQPEKMKRLESRK